MPLSGDGSGSDCKLRGVFENREVAAKAGGTCTVCRAVEERKGRRLKMPPVSVMVIICWKGQLPFLPECRTHFRWKVHV